MPDAGGRPFVYLAGPDVFYPEAAERGARLKSCLLAHGMLGFFPADSELDPKSLTDAKALAMAIARANEALMRKSDIVIANIEPWRGPEADDGTAYEIGVMAALGKLIVLYTSDSRPFARRIVESYYEGDVVADGAVLRGRRDGAMIEDFGLADNLMLINAAVSSAERACGETFDPAGIVKQSFEAAAAFAKQLWDKCTNE